jgi:very-short-patch-repair endonuclease
MKYEWVFLFVPKLKFSFPHFQPAALRGVQMGERPKAGRKGANMPRKPRSNPLTKHQAIELRKVSTPAERKLWSRIRNDQLGVTFRRQHAVGNYIPDFSSPKAKLVIELDGPPFGRNTYNRKSMMRNEQNIWNRKATK